MRVPITQLAIGALDLGLSHQNQIICKRIGLLYQKGNLNYKSVFDI